MNNIRIKLKPWRKQLLCAVLDITENESCKLKDFPVENYINVQLDDLQSDIDMQLSAIRASAAHEAFKKQSKFELAVTKCLSHVFGLQSSPTIVSLKFSKKGDLTSNECEYYYGSRSEIYDEIDCNLNFSFELEFKLSDGPTATLSYELDIHWTLECDDQKVHVEDVIKRTRHDTDCVEDITYYYPEYKTKEDAIKTLVEDIAVALGVSKWIIQDHVNIILFPTYPESDDADN